MIKLININDLDNDNMMQVTINSHNYLVAKIDARSAADDGELRFFTSASGTGSGMTERMEITSDGNILVGKSASNAGAAIAHIHVRENDGTPSRRLELYKEVVDRIRSSDTDVVLNLTTGMRGDLDIGQGKNPLEFGPLTDMANVMERIANAEQFLPEICTLDCGTLNFGDSSVITVNTPNDLRKAAKRLQEINVKPEIEAFDLGNMWFGAQLYKEGLLSDPPMFQMCLGIPWGCLLYTSDRCRRRG